MRVVGAVVAGAVSCAYLQHGRALRQGGHVLQGETRVGGVRGAVQGDGHDAPGEKGSEERLKRFPDERRGHGDLEHRLQFLPITEGAGSGRRRERVRGAVCVRTCPITRRSASSGLYGSKSELTMRVSSIEDTKARPAANTGSSCREGETEGDGETETETEGEGEEGDVLRGLRGGTRGRHPGCAQSERL